MSVHPRLIDVKEPRIVDRKGWSQTNTETETIRTNTVPQAEPTTNRAWHKALRDSVKSASV